MAYAVGDGPSQLWMPLAGEPVPEVFRTPPRLMRSFNAPFEMGILQGPVPRDHPLFALIPPENFSCVRAQGLALALPGKLENVLAALGSLHQKDLVGHRAMLSLQRLYRAGKAPTPKQLERLGLYCIEDNDGTQAIGGQLPFLSDTEQKVWRVNAAINERGIPIDLDLAHAGKELAQALVLEGNAELARITRGEITSTGQVKKLLCRVQDGGYRGASLRKQVVVQQLAQNDTIEPDDRRTLEIRRDHGLSSFRKFDTIINRTDIDGRARDSHDYHKASTGRFAGSGIQFQNMQRPVIDITDELIDIVLSRSVKRLRKFAAKTGVSPLAVLGSLVRSVIRAWYGDELVGADYSAVEARVLAFLAGEKWLLDAYAKFDATGRPEDEPYTIIASRIFRVPPDKITPEQRQIGKTATLAFGYMGGLTAWRAFLPDTLSDDEVLRLRNDWRKLHPNICKLWYSLNRSAIGAVKQPGRLIRCGLIDVWCADNFMFMELPSGRRLAYPFPSIVENSFGEDAVSFLDNSAGRFVPCRHGQGAFGGTFVENVTQAVARDVLAHALLAIDHAGLKTILHVHDEVLIEAPVGTVDPKQLVRLMVQRPRWALNMPLAAEGWRGKRYIKT